MRKTKLKVLSPDARLAKRRLGMELRTGRTRCVAPRSVRLTSPERVLFPDEGLTKQDLFEYYRAIAPILVPHLRNRPFTMKRLPYGVVGDAYFQKPAAVIIPWLSFSQSTTFRDNDRSPD